MFRSQNFNDDPNEPFEEKYNIFFDCLKTDLKNNEDEIKNNIDFSLIDERTRFIFNNMLKSSHYWELELRIRCFDLNTKSKN